MTCNFGNLAGFPPRHPQTTQPLALNSKKIVRLVGVRLLHLLTYMHMYTRCCMNHLLLKLTGTPNGLIELEVLRHTSSGFPYGQLIVMVVTKD